MRDHDDKCRRVSCPSTLLILALSSVFLPAPALAGGVELAVTGIQARLFYSSTGELSQDVLSDDDFILWNAVIGEGSAEGWSRATLVVVEVSAAPDAIDASHTLGFEAKYKVGEVDPGGKPRMREVVVEKEEPIGTFSATGKKYFAFWLAETGCNPVELRARILPHGETSEAVIPFICGE